MLWVDDLKKLAEFRSERKKERERERERERARERDWGTYS